MIGPKFSVINQAFFHSILKVVKDMQLLASITLPETNASQHQGDFGPKSQNSSLSEVAIPDLQPKANSIPTAGCSCARLSPCLSWHEA